MASMQQLEEALRRADQAGNTDDAKRLAQAIVQMRQAAPDAAAAAPKERGFIDRAADSASQFLEGATFGLTDEIQAGIGSLTGMGSYDELLDKSRGRTKEFQANNPIAAPALEMGGGIATAMTPIGAAGQAIGAPWTAANLGRSAAAGAGYGAAYGYGTGEGGAMNRLANVPINAAIGAAGGAAGNVAQEGVGRLSRALNTTSHRAANVGVRPDTYKVARQAAEMADADIAGGAEQYLRQGGKEAMLGDIMPADLDSITNASAGGAIARRNLNARVDRASDSVGRAMDDTLGTPQGVRQTARDVASSTRAARSEGYGAAYAQPIDYASDVGRNIESILQRIPARTMREAVDEANEAMTAAGARNQQIFVNVADDGSMSFREMPNVQQLDEIKKALQSVARDNVDQFGRPNARGNRANGLAGELRDALGQAVPEYNAATAAGFDKIAQDEALRLGQTLLSPSVTKEMAEEAAAGMGQAERVRASQGVRAYLDEVLGNVRATRTDPNIDQREAFSAIQRILTRNNQDKLRSILGADQADAFFAELTDAARSFNVRASAAANSATAGRGNAAARREAVARRGAIPDRPARSVVDSTLAIPARAFNAATGRSPGAITRRSDAIDRELAELLTGLRGDDAIAAFQRLMMDGSPPISYGRLSQRLARGSRLGAPPALPQPILAWPQQGKREQ